MKKNLIIISAAVAVIAGASAIAILQSIKRPTEVYIDPFAGISEQEAETVKTAQFDETKIDKLNEDVYDLTISPENNEIVINGKSSKLSDSLGVSESTVRNLASSGTLVNYLRYHLIGNVSEGENGQISVTNPYSTDALIVKGGNENELRNGAGVVEVKPVAKDYYIIKYASATKTKAGYADLINSNKVNGVITDLRAKISEENPTVKISDDKEYIKTTAATKAAASGYEAWGVESMGANHYTIKLEMAPDDEEIRVAVLDTGINASHDVFADETTADRLDLEHAHDYVNGDDDPTDDNGHGTEVSGVVVESTPTNVKVIPVKVMDDTGHGDFSDIIVAAYEISEYADVINMSLGLTETEDTATAVAYFNEILAEIDSTSTIMVASSGNEAASASCFPASSPSVWSIGAVDSSNVVADFSNHDDKVDFSAPGVDLKLPYYTGNNVYAVEVSGTSFSSPFVAAAAAMIKADHPDYTAADAYAVLQANSVDLGEPGKDEYYGHGSIDFDSDMFKSPVFVVVSANEVWSATSNNIIVGAVGDSVIRYVGVTTSNSEPTGWADLGGTDDYAVFNFDVDENGSYYAWAKDADNDIGSVEIIADHIDTTSPTAASQITRDRAANDSLTAMILVKEENSGVSSVAWTIVDPTTSATTTETDTHGDSIAGKSGTEVSIKHTFKGLTAEKTYNVSAAVTDLAGNTLSVPAATLRTGTIPANPAASDVQVSIVPVLSLSLLDPADTSREINTVNINVTPNNRLATASVLARSSGNTDYMVTIEMVGEETALTDEGNKIVGTTTDDVTAETMAPGSWGFSTDAINFSKVPAFGQPKTIKSVPQSSGHDDALITFGIKADQSTRSGIYSGSAIITVVANQ